MNIYIIMSRVVLFNFTNLIFEEFTTIGLNWEYIQRDFENHYVEYVTPENTTSKTLEVINITEEELLKNKNYYQKYFENKDLIICLGKVNKEKITEFKTTSQIFWFSPNLRYSTIPIINSILSLKNLPEITEFTILERTS